MSLLTTSIVDVYWMIAWGSSGLLVILVIVGLIGVDFDSIEIDIFGDSFSITSLIAFLSIGSWTGYLGSQMTSYSSLIVLLLSISMGLLAYVGSIFILRKLKKWESKGNVNLSNAIGKIGTVYLSIPGNKIGEGQIQVIVQGRLMTLEAISEDSGIATGEKVIVYDIENNKLLVQIYSEQNH